MPSSSKLPRHLRASLGPEAANELVTILDEIRADNARRDVQMDDFARRFEAIDRRFEAIDRRFDAIDRRFEKVDDRLNTIMEKLSDVQSNLMKWSFVFWCGAVTAIAALAGVLE